MKQVQFASKKAKIQILGQKHSKVPVFKKHMDKDLERRIKKGQN